jgi:hypothetical protein
MPNKANALGQKQRRSFLALLFATVAPCLAQRAAGATEVKFLFDENLSPLLY